jgi:predicted ribosomally synthesized peptide with SipW-like signal peptide
MMVEKNNKNKVATFSKWALSLRSGFYYALFVLLLAVALTGGMTSAWFTAGDKTENAFTAGTLDIQVDGPNDISGQQITTDVVFDPYCASLNYMINNRGTKTSYVRVKFEGHWERTYHKNTVTATVANYNITDSDSAHFLYDSNNNDNVYDASRDPNAIGFTDQQLSGPVIFSPLEVESGGINNGYSGGTSGTIYNTSIGIGSDSSNQSDLTASGEKFSFSDAGFSDVPVGDLSELFGPTGLNMLKLPALEDGKELDNEDYFVNGSLEVPGAYKITISGNVYVYESLASGSNLKITITRSADENSFTFNSNYPIYHVFVKKSGGEDKLSNLYTYYIQSDKYDIENGSYYVNIPSGNTIPFDSFTDQFESANNRLKLNSDPTNPAQISINGINTASGLGAGKSSPNGWSHITLYYSKPQFEPKPGLEIIKLLSLDGGHSWYANESESSTYYSEIIDLLRGESYKYTINPYGSDLPVSNSDAPIFKVIVGNTGNVDLIDIEVNDDYFENFYHKISLEPGQLWISDPLIFEDFLEALSPNTIEVKLQQAIDGIWDPSKWTPAGPLSLGEYFYHNYIIEDSEDVPLYIDICLKADALNKEYDGAIFKLYAYFEAVQTTNGLVHQNWNPNPYPYSLD